MTSEELSIENRTTQRGPYPSSRVEVVRVGTKPSQITDTRSIKQFIIISRDNRDRCPDWVTRGQRTCVKPTAHSTTCSVVQAPGPPLTGTTCPFVQTPGPPRSGTTCPVVPSQLAGTDKVTRLLTLSRGHPWGRTTFGVIRVSHGQRAGARPTSHYERE